MCVANADNAGIKLHACQKCRSSEQVVFFSAGAAKNQTFMVECICCQNATPILPDPEVRIYWNKENPR